MKPIHFAFIACVAFIALGFLSAGFIPNARAYVLLGCQWDHNGVTYFNGASAVESSEVPLAAEAWSDTPTLQYFVNTNNQQAANVAISSVNDPNGGYTGVTFIAPCNQGLYNGQMIIHENDAAFNGVSQDKITNSAAHEMGHSLGLDHSQVNAALMWVDDGSYLTYGIFVPVVDDIRALAQLYGWASDTGFGYSVTTGTGHFSGFNYPITLGVYSGCPGSCYAQGASYTSLPGSHIAVMTAYVRPFTLYRFHIGWEEQSATPTDQAHRYATLEFDNDGAKLVYDLGGSLVSVPLKLPSGSPPAITTNTSYFLEIVVEENGGNANSVNVAAYAFSGNMQTANGGEGFQGSINLDKDVACFFSTCTLDSWSSANLFDIGSWVDSSSNPASNYATDHFWNFQGAVPKARPAGTDFSLTSSVNSVTIPAHSSGAFTITATSLNSFAGTVTFSTTVSSPVLSATLNPTEVPVDQGGAGTSTLTVSATASGTYTVTLTGTSGSISHQITLTVVVTDFSVSANPSSTTVNAGTAGTTSVTVSTLNGFTGTVSLLLSSVPQGISCTGLSQSSYVSVTLSSSVTSASVSLSCTSSATGVYQVGIYACYNCFSQNIIQHTTTATFSFGDFVVSASPTSVILNPGSPGTSTVTVTGLNGFAGSVNLSPSAPSALSCTVSPAGLSLPPSPASATLTCSGSAPGTYNVIVTGANGALSHQTTVTFTIPPPDFAISTSPSSITVNAGTTSASTITISSLYGFGSTVNLSSTISPSTGLTCTLNPTSVTGSGSSTLSCSGSAGTYTVTVAGASGTLSHSTTVTYTVQDFTISTSPSSIPLTLAGSSATSTVTVASLTGFSAAVSLTFSTSPNGPVVSLWPASVTPSPGGSAASTLDISAGGATAGTYTITVTGTSGSLVHTATVTVTVTGDFSIAANPTSLIIPAGSSSTSNVTLTSLNGFSGTITLASSTSVSISAVSIDDQYCRSFGLLIDQPLNYPDFWNSQPNSVIGVGCSSFSYSNTYTLSSGSHFLEFGVSAWVGHWHIQITVNGVLMANVDTAIFNHVHVPFQVGGSSVSPVVTNGPAGSLSATSSTLSAGGSGTITLTISTTSSTPPQNYVFTLTATSGGLSHATTVTVHVVDFSISTSPSSSALTLAGSSTTSTVSVASLNGFSGTVPLTVSTAPAGPVMSLWPNSLTISSGGSATSTLSISVGAATPGTYAVTVSGTSGGPSHSATVTITVSGDFGISASPASLSVSVGKSASSTITLTSLNSFAGTISVSSQASISISATTTDDPYCRSFGLLIDQQLNYPDFWNSQPSSVIGTGCGSFTYSNTYSLTTGPHFLEFGVSAFVGHWHVQITVNGVVMASVDTNVSHHVHVGFNVGGVSVSPVVTSGPTGSFKNPTVTISAGGSGTTTLTVSTSKSTPTGTYTVTVTATSGGLSHTVTITVTVA